MPQIEDWLWSYLSPSWKLSSGVVVKLSDRSDWINFGDLFVNGEYDKAIAGGLREVSLSDTIQVVDLGANTGGFYLRFLHIYLLDGCAFNVRYTAVEPNPKCLARFAENFNANQDPRIKVRIIEGLVGLRQGQALFEPDDFHIGSRVVQVSAGHLVQKLPYIDLIQELPDGPIALLKVDIEGSEELFLGEYHDLLKRTQNLIIEIHGNLCDAEVCREKIGAAGLESAHVFNATEHYTLELYRRSH